MRRSRLRWFGHVERKEVDDWVSACRNLEVAGSRGRGRPRMTWRARLDGDMKDMGLRPEMAMDREMWRCGIMGRTPGPHISANITDVKRAVVVVVFPRRLFIPSQKQPSACVLQRVAKLWLKATL